MCARRAHRARRLEGTAGAWMVLRLLPNVVRALRWTQRAYQELNPHLGDMEVIRGSVKAYPAYTIITNTISIAHYTNSISLSNSLGLSSYGQNLWLDL